MSTYNENHKNVGSAMHSLLQAMAPYVATVLRSVHGDDWWQIGVMEKLYGDQKLNLPVDGDDQTLTGAMDIALCLRLVDLHWRDIFSKKFSRIYRSWAKELLDVRNKWAHAGQEEFDDNDTWRALDTMARLCDPLDEHLAGEIRDMLRQNRYGTREGAVAGVTEDTGRLKGSRHSEEIQTTSTAGLPSWREIITPHSDVAGGKYVNAEFAADLGQVARGEGALEYQDPLEFFSRTYVTEGMHTLLVQTLKRVTTGRSEPVIQLKTAFGGGKTHSMLAMYHLLRGRFDLRKIPALSEILGEVGTDTLPRVHTAVFVGTAHNPASSRRPAHMPGITINTAWGEIAAQLAFSAGDPKLYDIVREADEKGTPPGSVAFKELFDACGSCLVLMDELVAYARKLHSLEKLPESRDKLLPAGTFESFLTFVQEITEGARASKCSLVAASIPESEMEIGGEAGRIALETIEHVFGRMEAVWKPVTASEGFEIVRRRLFNTCSNPEARAKVCTRFSELYRKNVGDFPTETRELDYRRRLEACYPIHPEIFDRLYEDWATLDNFQRTRGVLRLMAAVIHELWMGQDMSPLIMPGSLPLDCPEVRNELTRHLPATWNTIVDGEVDGHRSAPYKLDEQNDRFGKIMAARRVTRTIFLGSAPASSGQQRMRGVELSRIRLGCAQPGDSIPVLNDAMNTLRDTLTYLYTTQNSDRFWFDTRQTLRKTARDREQMVGAEKVEVEIEARLRELRKLDRDGPFHKIHVSPASSADVPDEREARLVVLPPASSFTPGVPDCVGLRHAEEILKKRGDTPRKFRNTLVFLAADQGALSTLKNDVRSFIAWKSIEEDTETLNLDQQQIHETKTSLQKLQDRIKSNLEDTWRWLLVPCVDKTDKKTFSWETPRMTAGSKVVANAGTKLKDEGLLFTTWAPLLLKNELDQLLWKNRDFINIDTLWEHLCSYGYLPRLLDYVVLRSTIEQGVQNGDFAYADTVCEDSCTGLVVKGQATVKQEGFLLKPKFAETITPPPPPPPVDPGKVTPDPVTPDPITPPPPPPPPPSKVLRTFRLNTKLADHARIVRDLQNLMNEVVEHLENAKMRVNISLTIQADCDEGVSKETVRTVSENCKTLQVGTFSFDE